VVNPELPGTHRRVELDAHTDADPAPSAWSVDNTREIQHKAAGNFDTSKQTPAKVDPSPTAWSIDNTRETRHELSELTTEEQDEMKRKNGNLEVFIPKTAEEIDFIVQASGSWVGERLNKGVFAGKMPTFIINASEAVAVVSAFGDVFDAQSSKPTNKYASILNPSAKTAMDGPGGPDHRGPDLLPPPYSAGLRGGSELAGEPSEIILIIKSKSFGVREVILPVNDKPLHAGTLPGLVQRACDQMLAGHYTTKSSAKTAAAGGAAEEPESEEETSVDSVVVSLLEACKSEWTSLGDPVNPATWPKEIDRALLSLNDELVAAIKKVEDKLVEGEFYSKNVDEGLEGGGSSVDSLNIAPPETEAPDAMPMGDEGIPEADGLNTAADEADEPLLSEAPKTGGLKKRAGLDDVNQVPDFRGGIGLDTPPLPPSEALPQRNEFKVTFEDGNSLVTGFNGTLDDANAYYVGHGFNHGDVDGKDRIVRAVRVEQLNAPKIASAKNAVELPDVTTTETRKALKFTQSLQGDIATKFFEFKKVVQEANDSSLVKNVGEAFVALKTKLEDVEKILSKQLLLLETAESSIQDKKDSNAKKSFLLGADNFVKCSKCGKDFSCSPYGKEEKEPVCPNCEKGEKKEASAKTAFYPLLVIFKELKDFQQAHPEMSEEEALKAFASTGQGREIVQRAAERLSRAAEADVQKLQLTNQNHPTASAKTAACPVCGATVMQNGRDTNGVLCPNCADKPSTQVPGTSQSTTTPAVPKLPQNGPVNPSPIKQYGSKSKFKGLNLASAE
jgi:formylmethanofuran dehydrogenase subunit E